MSLHQVKNTSVSKQSNKFEHVVCSPNLVCLCAWTQGASQPLGCLCLGLFTLSSWNRSRFFEKVKTNRKNSPLWWREVWRITQHFCSPTNTSNKVQSYSAEPHKPILSYLCRNGVSCTSEILILKAPLWLNLLTVSLLDQVPICSVQRAVCVWVCVDPTSEYSIPSLEWCKATDSNV